MTKPRQLKDRSEEVLQKSRKEVPAGEPSFQKGAGTREKSSTYASLPVKIGLRQKRLLLFIPAATRAITGPSLNTVVTIEFTRHVKMNEMVVNQSPQWL